MICRHCGVALREDSERAGRYRYEDAATPDTAILGSGSECPKNERGHEPQDPLAEYDRSENWCIRNRNCTVEQAEHAVDCPARRRPYAVIPPGREGDTRFYGFDHNDILYRATIGDGPAPEETVATWAAAFPDDLLRRRRRPAQRGRLMRAVSAFAGIGGFDLGFAREGIETTCQIEWDAHCQTILARRFPGLTLHGDICDVRGDEIGRVDLATGGFPCQDTSIAAPHRSGLAGRRSGHFYEFVRLVEEYARLVDATNPRWVVIENPTGLLRSNGGRDAATVFGHLEDLGYGWAYRVVDGRHLGSPQRRGRVLVVGHRGGDPRPAWAVLGDAGDRSEADPARGVGRRPLGPAPAGGVAFDAVWRKSARPRAALSKGGYETWVADGVANTLTGFDWGGPARQTHLLAQSGRLRTLTITEWERLQGFPDDWTEGVPESARATALGNAMHVGMAQWLGRRLVTVDQRLALIGA